VVDRVVLVNGLPGSGKTTLATALATALPAPLIGKDALKEAVADAVPGVATGAIGPVVAELMWTLAAAVSGTAVLESWWFAPRDRSFVEAGLRRCAARTVVEVWCDVPPELARSRYAARHRRGLHEDQRHLVESWPRWAREAEPLGVGRTLRVSTDRPVDPIDVSRQINALAPP
jgi:predicted kinase